VGGTNPSLLQAMAARRPRIAYDSVFNKFPLDGNGHFYRDADTLYTQLRRIIDDVSNARVFARRVMRQARERYSWDDITEKYEVLFRKMTAKVWCSASKGSKPRHFCKLQLSSRQLSLR
jgi:glycosyltransferase involved in cell wall biosynthesis